MDKYPQKGKSLQQIQCVPARVSFLSSFVWLPLLSQERWEDVQQVLNIKPEHPAFSQADSDDDEKKNKSRKPFSCGFPHCAAQCDTAPVTVHAIAGLTTLITGFFYHVSVDVVQLNVPLSTF